jgi:ADP-ribose pyrophosphatase
MPRPWSKLAERSTRDFHIFKTHTFDAADPRNGKAHVRTVIEAPDWVNVVALTRGPVAEQVVLVRQFRFGVWAPTLEIPGGMVDEGEDPSTAAARELEEETGYRPGSLERIGLSHPNPALFGNRLHSYLARECVRVHDGHQDDGEDIEVELVTREQLKSLVFEGAITHSLVLAALLFESWR